MLSETAIQRLVDLIEHQVEQIETRYEGRWQVDVPCDREFGIVLRTDGIRGGKDGSARIEGRDDTGLSD